MSIPNKREYESWSDEELQTEYARIMQAAIAAGDITRDQEDAIALIDIIVRERDGV